MVQLPTNDGLVSIHVATMNGDIKAVKRELDTGVPVDWNSFANSVKWPLQIAVERRDRDVVTLLLEYRADADEFCTDTSRMTAVPGQNDGIMTLLEARRKRRKL